MSEHIWASRVNSRRVFCACCGVMRRVWGKPQAPCRGVVRVQLREAQP